MSLEGLSTVTIVIDIPLHIKLGKQVGKPVRIMANKNNSNVISKMSLVLYL